MQTQLHYGPHLRSPGPLLFMNYTNNNNNNIKNGKGLKISSHNKNIQRKKTTRTNITDVYRKYVIIVLTSAPVATAASYRS